MTNPNPQDVRCILLCKSFQARYNVFDDLKEKFLEEEQDSALQQYTALGEFDAVFTMKLDTTHGLLNAIERNNTQLSNQLLDSIFFRPLYLVYPDESESASENLESFWADDSPFFFITIVHVNHCSAGYEHKKQGRIRIDELIRASNGGANGGSPAFVHMVYDSLDLSDYIILWKAPGPKPVLKALLHICQQTNLVGYTNTICSLPRKLLSELDQDIKKAKTAAKEKFPKCEKKEKKLARKNVREAVERKIGKGKNDKDHFAMTIRAVSKSYQGAKAIHDEIMEAMNMQWGGKNEDITKKPYFMMGHDDYLGIFPDTSPRSLSMLHSIIAENQKFRESILSINTTLAIPSYDQAGTAPQDDIPTGKPTKSDLEDACRELSKDFKDLIEDNKSLFAKFPWPKPAIELLSLLNSMSKSTIFDSVCFLSLDSAHIFYTWLSHMITKFSANPQQKLIEKEQQIEKFLREWNQISDHVVRMDGTLRQTPGYEPLSHSMSASIVEFSNAYAQKLIKYLTVLDNDERKRRFACFVVPKLCRNFKTEQWFADELSMDNLLFITIPISKMYDLRFIMIALAHEVSHHCSDKVRLREKRLDMLFACAATLLCQRLFGVESKKTAECCKKALLDINEESDYRKKCGDNRFYLKETKVQVKQSILVLMDIADEMKKLLTAHCQAYDERYPDTPMDDQKKRETAMKIHKESMQIMAASPDYGIDTPSGMISINDQVDDIAYYFKEGFADLMMIHILSLDPGAYLEAVFYNLSKLDGENDKGKLHQGLQLLMVVCKTLITAGIWSQEAFENAGSAGTEEGSEQYPKLYQEFRKSYGMWRQRDPKLEKEWEKNEGEWYYPWAVLDIIAEYLGLCLDKVSECETEDGKEVRKEIAHAYRDMARPDKNLFSREFQGILQENRIEILNRWKKREADPYKFDS